MNNAVIEIHGKKDAFSTGSQNHHPPTLTHGKPTNSQVLFLKLKYPWNYYPIYYSFIPNIFPLGIEQYRDCSGKNNNRTYISKV